MPAATNTVWDDQSLESPHTAADKRQRVQKMFAAIAPSYDLNNRLHSLWMDQRWRRKAVKLATLNPTDKVVDVACGTGDLTLKFWAELAELRLCGVDSTLEPEPLTTQVIGIDFTYEMLPIAARKSEGYECYPTADDAALSTHEKGYIESFPSLCRITRHISFINGDALALPLPDAAADVVSIAFGIRNVADPAAAIREFHRVLRPGGRLVILEFSLPTNSLLRTLYNFYFRKILPRTATWISRDKTGAYKYLPESVNTFITRDRMQEMMRDAGFQQVEQHPLTFGVCVCYRGVKV